MNITFLNYFEIIEVNFSERIYWNYGREKLYLICISKNCLLGGQNSLYHLSLHCQMPMWFSTNNSNIRIAKLTYLLIYINIGHNIREMPYVIFQITEIYKFCKLGVWHYKNVIFLLLRNLGINDYNSYTWRSNPY